MFESICLDCKETYNPEFPGQPHFHESGLEGRSNYQGYWGTDPTILARLQLIEDFHSFLCCELLDEYYARAWEWIEKFDCKTVPGLYTVFLSFYPGWED